MDKKLIIDDERLLEEMDKLEEYLVSRDLSANDGILVLQRTLQLATLNYTRKSLIMSRCKVCNCQLSTEEMEKGDRCIRCL